VTSCRKNKKYVVGRNRIRDIGRETDPDRGGFPVCIRRRLEFKILDNTVRFLTNSRLSG
jgi:hypothetical protein